MRVGSTKITHVLIGDSSDVSKPTDGKNWFFPKKISDVNDKLTFNDSCIGGTVRLISKRLSDDLENWSEPTFDSLEGLTINITDGKIDGLENDNLKTSCFEICKDDSGIKALVKIFIRQTYDDVEGKTTDKISCIGLCMGNPKESEGSTLFSRVVFPPYYKSSAQAIVFNYYIYF